MTADEPSPWPPIVSAANLPRRVVWRDIAATLVMWVVFIYAAGTSLDVFGQAVRILSGRGVESADPALVPFLERMIRRFGIIALMVTFLALSTLRSIRIHNRALSRPRATAVSDAELARELGLEEPTLSALRLHKVLTLDVDDRGRAVLDPDTA